VTKPTRPRDAKTEIVSQRVLQTLESQKNLKLSPLHRTTDKALQNNNKTIIMVKIISIERNATSKCLKLLRLGSQAHQVNGSTVSTN